MVLFLEQIRLEMVDCDYDITIEADSGSGAK